MGNFKELCKCSYSFFQTPSPSSPTEGGSSSNSEDTTYGVPRDSQKDPPSYSSHDQDEHKENDCFNFSSPKDSSSSFAIEKVHKPVTPLPPFPHSLQNKNQINVDKIREAFSQVKSNILLLDCIQQMTPYARFWKDLCITERATSASKKAFLASSASSIISH